MELRLLNEIRYIEKFLKIKTKKGNIIPFRLNAAQLKLYDIIKAEKKAGKPVRIIILKARQLGFSTLCEALLFHSSATRDGINSIVVAHREDSTANLFAMSRLFYEELPENVRPKKKNSNAQELIFDNPARGPADKEKMPGLRSRIRCSTAGGQGVGRSETLTNVHLSEYAFWSGDKEATLLGIMQAVPSLPGTSVFIESTANGYDAFKKRWDMAVSGESDFISVFFAWFENPEYRTSVPDGTVWTADEKEIAERYSLDDKQLAWRRWCIRNNCSGNEDTFRQEYPACADEAFLTSGSAVFDNEIIIKRRGEAPKPLRRGEFKFNYDGMKIKDIRFAERENGFVSIYEEPKQYHPYVIGGDTAGEGSDYFTGQVIDNTDGHQAAALRHQFDEDLYARQMYCLGTYYNDALIGIEVNYSTYPIKELERLRYPRLYVRQAEDTFTHKMKESFGFMTTGVTRPVIIAALVEIMRDTPELVCDFTTLGEMLTFVYNEHRRPEAMDGEHDDCVMAMAIAHYIRPQMTYTATVPEGKRVAWTEDQWYDYNHASADLQKMLIEKWGNPK
jgi:hypothetical protein